MKGCEDPCAQNTSAERWCGLPRIPFPEEGTSRQLRCQGRPTEPHTLPSTSLMLCGPPHKLCLAGCPLNPLTAAGGGSRALSTPSWESLPNLSTPLLCLWVICASGNKFVEVQTEAERTPMNSNHSVLMFSSKFKKKKKSRIFFCGTSKGLHLSSLPPSLEISKKKGGRGEKNVVTKQKPNQQRRLSW